MPREAKLSLMEEGSRQMKSSSFFLGPEGACWRVQEAPGKEGKRELLLKG